MFLVTRRRHSVKGLPLAVLALLLVACTRQVVDTGSARLWPPPPNTPRYMHEATVHNGEDIADPEQAGERALMATFTGMQPDNEPVFQKPMRVAAAAGTIYVTDTRAGYVHVFDVPRHRYYALGYRLEGNLSKPIGIALDGLRRVYVADQANNRIVVFDRYGLYQHFIGENHVFDRLTGVGVSIDGERIYAVDTGGVSSEKHEIVVFDGSGKLLATYGRRGQADGEFNLPTDIVVTPDGELVILDAGNFRVQVLDSEGRFLRSWGKAGNGLGQLARPRGLAIDGSGLIYVADAYFSNIQVYTPQGELLLPIGERSLEEGGGHYALIAGLAVDETDRLYVLDQYFRKMEVIKKIRPGGNL